MTVVVKSLSVKNSLSEITKKEKVLESINKGVENKVSSISESIKVKLISVETSLFVTVFVKFIVVGKFVKSECLIVKFKLLIAGPFIELFPPTVLKYGTIWIFNNVQSVLRLIKTPLIHL